MSDTKYHTWCRSNTTRYIRAGLLHYGGEVHQSWKKGRFSIVIGRKCNSWPVGIYTRWRKEWWWTFLMDDKMTWPPPWRHFLELGFSRASPDEEFLEAGEAQLNKKYFIAFNPSPAHPPFASYNHVFAKHSWPIGGFLHRSGNWP